MYFSSNHILLEDIKYSRKLEQYYPDLRFVLTGVLATVCEASTLLRSQVHIIHHLQAQIKSDKFINFYGCHYKILFNIFVSVIDHCSHCNRCLILPSSYHHQFVANGFVSKHLETLLDDKVKLLDLTFQSHGRFDS